MNYLQLTQTLHGLLRAGQDNLSAAPPSVANNTGLLGELPLFINLAWQDIQNDTTRWLFMRKQGEIVLPTGQRSANPGGLGDFDQVLLADPFGAGRFITALPADRADEHAVRYLPYQDWQQGAFDRGTRSEGQPSVFTIMPSGMFRFDAIADQNYTLRFDYRRTNQQLAKNDDTPIMPSRFHMVIVWWAIKNYYCSTRDDTQAFAQKSALQLKREMQKLVNEQTSEWATVGSLR